MEEYSVLLRGRGLKLHDSGPGVESGVFTWVAVSATDEISAGTLAREALLADPAFAMEILNESLSEVAVSVERVVKLVGKGSNTGFVFYTEPTSSG